MRVGTVKLIETKVATEKMAEDVLALAQGYRPNEPAHKRLLAAYTQLRRAADELNMAQAGL